MKNYIGIYQWEAVRMKELVRFGVSMPSDLLKEFDDWIARKEYENRSEAIRNLARGALVEESWQEGDSEVAGTVTLVYDHHISGLNDLLNNIQHDHHDIIISALHVHLDHHNCLEILIVKGKASEAKNLADRLLSIKGIKHGRLTTTTTGRDLT
jgi:CopG family nickel-responsive transcriptional regulator